MPHRIQLRRTRGWRLPAGAIKVDRSTIWGNPWSIHEAIESGLFERQFVPQVCYDNFRRWLGPLGLEVEKFPIYVKLLTRRREILENLHLLRGKDLACWCPLGQLCHADILIELANK